MPRAYFSPTAISLPSLFLLTFSESCFLVLSQLWGICFQPRRGIIAAGTPSLRGLGLTLLSSHSPFFLWLAPHGHVRAGGWNSELWLLALLFLFKNRLVCGVLLSSLPCSDWDWRQKETATGQTEVAEENLLRCLARDPGPQLQAATI